MNPELPLENQQHEQCITHYLAGFNKIESLRLTYGEDKTHDNTNQVFQRDDVKARIRHLQSLAATESVGLLSTTLSKQVEQLLEHTRNTSDPKALLGLIKGTESLSRSLNSMGLTATNVNTNNSYVNQDDLVNAFAKVIPQEYFKDEVSTNE